MGNNCCSESKSLGIDAVCLRNSSHRPIIYSLNSSISLAHAPSSLEAAPVSEMNKLLPHMEKLINQEPSFPTPEEMLDNLPRGIEMGPYRYIDNSTYFGEFLDGKRTGLGTQVWSDGTIYHGFYLSGAFNGPGFLATPSNIMYRGMFINNSACGKGVLRTPSSTYTGEFKDDLPDGFGTERSSNEVFSGFFKNGKRNGQGKAIYTDGTSYDGFWKSDLMDENVTNSKFGDSPNYNPQIDTLKNWRRMEKLI